MATGPTLDEQVGAFEERFLELLYVKSVYWELFERGNLREAMARKHGGLFNSLRVILIVDMIRVICSLTDPKGDGDRSNLTIERLAHAVASSFAHAAPGLRARAKEIESALCVVRQHRHKRFAHFDLATAVQPDATLKNFGLAELWHAVDLIGKFLNQVEDLLGRNITVYECLDTGGSDQVIPSMLRASERLEFLWWLAVSEEVSDREVRECAVDRFGRRETSRLVEMAQKLGYRGK